MTKTTSNKILIYIYSSFLISLTFFGCGGGGGSESSNTISGKVADGYIVGAKVCLDLNENNSCDEDEPMAISKEGGEFSLTIDKSIDTSLYSCIVEVPVGAIDEDDNKKIEKPYTMSAPKGVSEFLSPVSTIVKTIQEEGNLTIAEAKAQYRSKIGLTDNSVEILDNYIDSENLTKENKDKLHNIAKVTAKIMAENQNAIIKSLENSNLKSSHTHKESLKTINNHVLTQLPAISDLKDVSDESMTNIDKKIDLTNLYTNLQLNETQQKSFVGSLDTPDEPIIPVESCTESENSSDTLEGITYCVNIDGNKISKLFSITEEQNTLIYLKNLVGQTKFKLFKKNGTNYDKVEIPFFRNTQDGKIYIFGGKGDYKLFRLKQGDYKIEFDEANWISSKAEAKVTIIAEPTNKISINSAISSKVVLDPYAISKNQTKTIKGTLHSVFDYDFKDKLLDIIPIKSSTENLKVSFTLSGDFQVKIVNSVYFAKLLYPSKILNEDGILFNGSASQLMNKEFFFTKQSNKDDAYYVLVSSSFNNEHTTYYLNNRYYDYELKIQSSEIPEAILNVDNKNYKASIKQTNIASLLNPINIKYSNNTNVPDNEFYSSINTAKQFTSSLQTLHSILNFDEGAMMRFYDGYIKTIDSIHTSQTAMVATETLTSIVINSKKFDIAGLSQDAIGITQELLNYNQNNRAKALGVTFLNYGFTTLREYSKRKKSLLTKYLNNTSLLTDANLLAGTPSELTELYILQQKAILLMQYGMQVYQSTTNLEDRTLMEYFNDRLVAMALAFFPKESLLKDAGGFVSLVNSQNEKLSDLLNDANTLNQIESTYKEMWEKLLDTNNYYSFYNEKVQTNNIILLKALNYTFSDVIVDNQAPQLTFSNYPVDTIKSTDSIFINLSWNENINDFEKSDITITGGKIINLNKTSDNIFSLEIQAYDYSKEDIVITILENGVTDNASNQNQQKVLKLKTYTFPDGYETVTHKGLTYGTITSPNTNRVWLDRNLGATKVCQDRNDEKCFGDYYQWGRLADGHEKTTSNTSTTQLTSMDEVNSDFILYNDSWDWLKWLVPEDYRRNIDNRINRWAKTDGTSVCPKGFRVPEWKEFENEFTKDSKEKDFFDIIKVPDAGKRLDKYLNVSNKAGDISRVYAYLWTNMQDSGKTHIAKRWFNETTSSIFYFHGIKTHGYPIRCIKPQ